MNKSMLYDFVVEALGEVNLSSQEIKAIRNVCGELTSGREEEMDDLTMSALLRLKEMGFNVPDVEITADREKIALDIRGLALEGKRGAANTIARGLAGRWGNRFNSEHEGD